MSELAISGSSRTPENSNVRELAIAVLDEVLNIHGDPKKEGQSIPLAYTSVPCRAGETFEPITIEWHNSQIVIQGQAIESSPISSHEAHLLVLQTDENTIEIVIGRDSSKEDAVFAHWTRVGSIMQRPDSASLIFKSNPALRQNSTDESTLEQGSSGKILIGTTLNTQNSHLDSINFQQRSAYDY